MPRLATTAITFLTLALPAFAQVDSLQHFLAAKSFFEQQNFQSAANELRLVLQDNTLSPTTAARAHANLGAIFDLTGQPDRALREYNLALLVNAAEAEHFRSIATQRLTEGVTPSPATLHHLWGAYFPSLKVPKPVLKVSAEYSREARIAQLEGAVGFLASIAPDGSVQDLRLTQPLALGLDEAAATAAKRWSFEPATPGDLTPATTTPIELDFIIPAKTSRWHLVGVSFNPPAGANSPHFVTAPYPSGSGVSDAGLDEAVLVKLEKRQAMVTLSFAVDEKGHPIDFQTQDTTYPSWGPEAIAFVSKWRFTPGTRNAKPIVTPCTVALIWAEKQFTSDSIARARQTAGTMIQAKALRTR